MLGKSKETSFDSKFEIQEEKQQLELYSVTKSLDHPKRQKNDHYNTFKFIKKEVDKVKYYRIKRDLQNFMEDATVEQYRTKENHITTEQDFIRYYKTEQLKAIFDMCHDHSSAYNHAYESCMASRNGLRAWTNKHKSQTPQKTVRDLPKPKTSFSRLLFH